MKTLKYYYLLSGRLEADIRNYGKFFDYIKDYLTKPILVNNPCQVEDGAIVISHGYLGLSRSFFINNRKKVKLFILDNPMIRSNDFDTFRVQDKNLKILEVPSHVSDEVSNNTKKRLSIDYLNSIKINRYKINKKRALNINISFPHGDLIKLISIKKISDFNEKLKNMQTNFEFELIGSSKNNAILELDKYFLPKKYNKVAEYKFISNNVPYFVFSFQSALIHKYQLLGCKTITSEYNPFHSQVDWPKLSIDQRINLLSNIYIKKTFTGKEFSRFIQTIDIK